MNEATVMRKVWLAISRAGSRLFRNNVGKLKTEDGRFVRFGLCEGSSDLIGWTPYVIRPEDVAADNTIAHSKIAEARISYGGRGDISNVQRDRYGKLIYDQVTPF